MDSILIVDTAMKARIQKWGNSLAVRIPQPFAIEATLEENSAVDLSVRNGKIIIAPVAEPKLVLEELVSRITKANRHEEVETGKSRGNEAW